MPFWYIWRILKEVIEVSPDYGKATNVTHYGWMAVLFAVLAVLIYVGALMCSHLAAFRIATNLRIEMTEHIATLPLGKIEQFGSGKLRRIISETSGAAETYLTQLPDKWNSNIGENGCELSGGERQRISIARAFLKDALIILLDEATASLDVENETAIQTALSRLIKNKTVMIIAHRMRTVSGTDKIVVLKDGVVAEQGRPDELLEKKGIFSHMVELQTESQNWSLA